MSSTSLLTLVFFLCLLGACTVHTRGTLEGSMGRTSGLQAQPASLFAPALSR